MASDTGSGSPQAPKILVRELKRSWGTPEQSGTDSPESFTSIVVLPVTVSELVMQRYSGSRFTWLRQWGDLRSLNRRVVAGAFKVFAHHQHLEKHPPKLFIATIATAADR